MHPQIWMNPKMQPKLKHPMLHPMRMVWNTKGNYCGIMRSDKNNNICEKFIRHGDDDESHCQLQWLIIIIILLFFLKGISHSRVRFDRFAVFALWVFGREKFLFLWNEQPHFVQFVNRFMRSVKRNFSRYLSCISLFSTFGSSLIIIYFHIIFAPVQIWMLYELWVNRELKDTHLQRAIKKWWYYHSFVSIHILRTARSCTFRVWRSHAGLLSVGNDCSLGR